MDQKSKANNFSFSRFFMKSFGLIVRDRVNPCMKLIKDVLESENSNLVVSPLCIDLILGRLVSGASGETLKQVLEFLNCESLDALKSRHYRLMFGRREQVPTETKLSFAVGVCIRSALKPSLREIAHADYLETVDSKSQVNTLVEKQTNGLIQDLVDKNSVSTMLARTLYCLGCWKYANQFIPSLTEMSKFNLLGGKESVAIPFMSSLKDQYICCFDSFKVLKLPYKSEGKQEDYKYMHNNPDSIDVVRDFSMYIILPEQRDGLGELIEKVSSDPAAFLDQYLRVRYPLVPTGEFKIPKFKICFDFEAETVLQKAGLVLPFDKSNAELTELWNTKSKLYAASNKLFVDRVHHKCFAQIDEEGNGDVIREESGICSLTTRPPPVDFVADHPFIFIIREEKSGVVWFIGKVLNPSLSN